MSSSSTNTTEWDGWFTTCCTEYVAPAAIKGYNYLPRGGVNIAEVNFIQAYTTGEWNQYIWSVIIVPGIILGMLLMWILLLFLLKCLGQKRVGFWSGASMEKPVGLNAIDSKTGERIPYKRPRRVRICFMIFALLLLVFTATYTILGIGNLQTTATHLVEAGNIALNVTEDASENLKTLTAFVTEARMRTDSMMDGIDELSCPALNMEGSESFKEQAMDFQTNNLVFVDDTLLDLQTKMITLQDTLGNVTYVMETSNSAFSNQPYYCIPIVVLVVLLMLSLILVACTDSSKHRSLKGFGNCWSCLTTWFLMPLFILVMILFWIFGCTIFVTAIMNADMCQGTPPPSGSSSSSSSSMSYVSDGMSRESQSPPQPQKEPRTDVVFTDESSSPSGGGDDQNQQKSQDPTKPNPVYTLMAIFGDYTYYTGTSTNQGMSSSTTNTYQISKLVQYYAGCDMLFPYKENYLFYLEELYQTIIPNAQMLLDGTGMPGGGTIGAGSDEEDDNMNTTTTNNTTDETLNTTETTNGTLSSVLLPPPANFIPGEGVLGRPTELNGENLVTPALPLEEEEKKGNGRFLQKEREPNDEVLDEGEEPADDETSATEPTSGNETTSEVPTLYNSTTTSEPESNATTTTTDEAEEEEEEEEEALPEAINITTTTNDTVTDTEDTPTNITTTTNGECMSPDDIKEVLEDLQLWLNELEQSPIALKDFVEVMSCERVSPAYAKSVNEALCNYNITALTWLMMSMLSMSICGFVMITLRSAVKPVVLQEEDDDDDDRRHENDDNMETNPQVHGAVLYSDNEGYADDSAYQKAMDQVGGQRRDNDDSDSYEHDPAPDEQRQIETGVYTKLRAADDR